MEEQKLDKIKRLTSFSLKEIIAMDDASFWTNITYLLAKGVLTKEQHSWLDKQRTNGWVKDPVVLDMLDTFRGKVVE